MSAPAKSDLVAEWTDEPALAAPADPAPKPPMAGDATLRDLFAMHAIASAVDDYDRRTRIGGNGMTEPVLPYAAKAIGTREEIIARQAYCYADAMMRERGK